MKKILFLSHGHPKFSKGGGEVAAWNLYSHCKQLGYKTLFLARTEGNAHGGSSFSIRSEEEILLHSSISNWFTLTNDNVKQIFTDLVQLVQHYEPDVIHVHHYIHIGVEVFAALRRAAPKAKIIFTIHEYMAICQNNGQMVKPNSFKLCYKSSPADCHRCFPDISPGNFFLKKNFVLDQFSYVDQFVSPSLFLKQRYVDWGLTEQKIKVIENVLPEISQLPPREIAEGEKRARLAFFGQINPYKGIDVLLKALLLLPKNLKKLVHLDIHGANLDLQTQAFQSEVQNLLLECGSMVTMRGAYESHQLPVLMYECDWMVIPSIWWENSPVVIQEARSYGRPVIGSDIGGTNEKIENISGLTFTARSPASLAKTIEKAIEPDIFNEWYTAKRDNAAVRDSHLELIEEDLGVN